MNVIGLDVSKDKLDCAWLRDQDKVKTKVSANKLTGWRELVDWSLKNTGLTLSDLHFVMEATGVYHEQLAIFLYDAGAKVSVVNPAQIKFYAQGLGVRSKNRVPWGDNPKMLINSQAIYNPNPLHLCLLGFVPHPSLPHTLG